MCPLRLVVQEPEQGQEASVDPLQPKILVTGCFEHRLRDPLHTLAERCGNAILCGYKGLSEQARRHAGMGDQRLNKTGVTPVFRASRGDLRRAATAWERHKRGDRRWYVDKHARFV